MNPFAPIMAQVVAHPFLGNPRNRATQDIEADILEAYEQKPTLEHVAQTVGVSRQRASGVLRKWGKL